MKKRSWSLLNQLAHILLTFVCLLLCFAAATRAQGRYQWQQLTPLEGGLVRSLLSEGGRVYAGTSLRGVFVSIDNGATWREANNGLGNVAVFALVASGGDILAAASTGIYRSNNGGQSWTRALASNQAMTSLVLSSASIFTATSSRVFHSIDNGQSWIARSSLPGNPAIRELAVQGENLFAGTSLGVYRSSDQGQNWTMVGNGLPDNGAPSVSSLGVNNNTVYLGTVSSSQVYSSGDNGQNWAPAGGPIRFALHGGTVGVSSVFGFSFDGGDVYAFGSFGAATYNGQAWSEIPNNRGLPVGMGINALIRSDGTLLLGTVGGIYRLSSDGQSWTKSNSGLTAATVNAIAVAGSNILASADAGGFFRSGDDGKSWTEITDVNNSNGRPFYVTTLGVKGETIYAGISRAGGIFRSNDGGVSWTQINDGFRATGPVISDLAVSDEGVYAASFGRIYKLNPDNTSWTELTPNSTGISRLAASGSNVYFINGSATMRSTDGGMNFAPMNVGAALTSSFAIAARGSNVYLSAISADIAARIFLSTNGGESFTPSQPTFLSTFLPSAFAFRGDNLYAAGNGVLFSDNNGVRWTPVNVGLANRIVNTLAFKGETVLAGTNGYSIYAATDPRPAALTNVSAASFRADAELAIESITAAFGTDLATMTVPAVTQPLPITLATTRVIVRDRTGMDRNAPLFFVSPGQVNYQIPPDTSVGSATITIIGGDGSSSVGNVMISRVAPGLFAANANGQGVAAAVALRVKADGTRSYEPVVQFDASSKQFIASPLDLGPEGDRVFLLLFGTGIRFHSGLSAVTARVGGADAPVTFAGALGGFAGVDQINMELPRILIGRGEMEIAVTVDGKTANPLKVNIR